MINELWNDFHFLRPGWLLLLLPSFGLWWQLVRAEDPRRDLGNEIAPHLLMHLVTRPEANSRLRPTRLLLALWLVGSIAIAGPSFRRQPSPFAEDNARLIIVVKMTPSMMTNDLLPSRLERVRTKLHDLLDLRRGAGTGLIAYSGSAHLVMPVTTDGAVIDHMLQSLDPSVMPTEGDNIVEALSLAAKQIEPPQQVGQPPTAGSILLVTDGVEASQVTAMGRWRSKSSVSVQILAPLASDAALDRSGLAAAATTLGASIFRVTADDRDITSIASRADRAITTIANDDSIEWRDDGYLLVPILAVGMLFWCRRGWSVNPNE